MTILWASDVFICFLCIIFIISKTRGGDRQGVAYALFRLGMGARSPGNISHEVLPVPSSSEHSVGIAVEEASCSDKQCRSPATRDSSLPYSNRWLLADAAIATALALIQVKFIGWL
jgi:hypothetical protein